MVRSKWLIPSELKRIVPFKGYRFKRRERVFPPRLIPTTPVPAPLAHAQSGAKTTTGTSSAAADVTTGRDTTSDGEKGCFTGMRILLAGRLSQPQAALAKLITENGMMEYVSLLLPMSRYSVAYIIIGLH